MDEGLVDRGDRGHGEGEAAVYISGPRRGIVTRRWKKCLQPRQAIEPVIGHRKSDGHLGRNWLQGMAGDRGKVLRCGVGHHRRRILRPRRFLGRWILVGLGGWILGFGGGIGDVLRGPECPGATARWKIPASESGSVPALALSASWNRLFRVD